MLLESCNTEGNISENETVVLQMKDLIVLIVRKILSATTEMGRNFAFASKLNRNLAFFLKDVSLFLKKDCMDSLIRTFMEVVSILCICHLICLLVAQLWYHIISTTRRLDVRFKP